KLFENSKDLLRLLLVQLSYLFCSSIILAEELCFQQELLKTLLLKDEKLLDNFYPFVFRNLKCLLRLCQEPHKLNSRFFHEVHFHCFLSVELFLNSLLQIQPTLLEKVLFSFLLLLFFFRFRS